LSIFNLLQKKRNPELRTHDLLVHLTQSGWEKLGVRIRVVPIGGPIQYRKMKAD
jgi:hypothetical protein